MFCKYCGKKLEKPEQLCPYCGKEQGMLRVTDGYFGILENMASPEIERSIVQKDEEIEDKGQERENKKEIEGQSEDGAKSGIIDTVGIQLNWKRFTTRKCLGVIAIVALLMLFVICNLYQNRGISELRKRVFALEEQIRVYQESAENENEEKIND